MNPKKALTIAGALVGGIAIYWLLKKLIAALIFGVAVTIAYFVIKNVFSKDKKDENTDS